MLIFPTKLVVDFNDYNFTESIINHLATLVWRRASTSVELYFLAFSNSKSYFIYFNTLLYNSPNINGSILTTISFK